MQPLVDWLRGLGRSVVSCRDPGHTQVGDAIRQILLHRQDIPLGSTTEMLLYMAARAQLVCEVIAPALDRGQWVVSDRFLPANIVYQGHAGGLDPDLIRRVGEVATAGILPDLVLLLDVDPATAAARMNRPLDRLENRGDDYRRRLRDGYRKEAAADPARYEIIDATADPTTVGERIRGAIAARCG
jgi:dTMP kinase